LLGHTKIDHWRYRGIEVMIRQEGKSKKDPSVHRTSWKGEFPLCRGNNKRSFNCATYVKQGEKITFDGLVQR